MEQEQAHSGPAGLLAGPAVAAELLRPDRQGECLKLCLQEMQSRNTSHALTLKLGSAVGWCTTDGYATALLAGAMVSVCI